VPERVIVIPTYNERGNIERLLPDLLDFDPALEVVVVDDQSPDGTADAVDAIGRERGRVQVVRRHAKEGIGPAYRSGFKRALEMGAELIVQMDADFSHPPGALPEFFAYAADADVVLGSRYLNGITVVNWPIERLLISYFGNWYVRRVLRLPVRDATGGFKCWRREALLAIHPERVRSNGYAFQIETTYRSWRQGLRIRELPIVFMDRTVGDSKMSKRIGLEALWIVWWLKLAGLLGRL